MPLKYPNKCKRAGYWPAYEQARINDFRRIWQEICGIVPQLPVEHRRRGRPPNLELRELYCLCALWSAFDLTLREMEAHIPLLLGKSLDHTNLSRWFGRLDPMALDVAIVELNHQMTKRRKIEYVVDSTPFTLTRYRSIRKGGQIVLELLTWKLHHILAYLPTLGLLSVVSVHTTHGDAHDSPPYRKHLLPKAELRPNIRMHGDAAYWAIENIRQTKARKVIPNFVPREGATHSLVLKTALAQYDNDARKRYRGMVEGSFGGLATRQGTLCRAINHHTRDLFLHALDLAQQIRTYMRFKVLVFLVYFRTNPNDTNIYINRSQVGQ